MINQNGIPSFFYDDEKDKKESEIMIDYFLSWTLRCAVTDNESIPKVIRTYAKKILLKILSTEIDLKSVNEAEINILKVDTWKQWERIDVHAEVVLRIKDDIKKYAIVFENKMYTHIHGNQLKEYFDVFEKYYKSVQDKKDFERVYVFLTCHDPVPEEDIEKCIANGYEYYTIQSLRDTFKDEPITGNYLFDEFWFRYY